MLLDKYKKGSLRAKKDKSMFIVETMANCVEGGACRVQQLLFDFRCTSDYVMASFYVLVSVRLYKGLMLKADDA